MSSDYGTADPRSALKPKTSAKAASFPVRGCGYGRFFDQPAQIVEADGATTWIIRGANAVVAITEVRAGTVLARQDNPDEYMLLLDYDGGASCSAGQDDVLSAGPASVTIVPPGPSSITFHKPGHAVRCFTSRAEDLATSAQNAAAYAAGSPECAPLVDWPTPPGGFRLRNYDLRSYERVTFAHIIRSTNLMLSTPLRSSDRRSPQAVSPHHHDDFEQVSIVLEGTWVHHLRTPWTANMTAWRADEHAVFASPSALIIPSGMIHTSQDVGPGDCWLIDLFSPPARGFLSPARLGAECRRLPGAMGSRHMITMRIRDLWQQGQAAVNAWLHIPHSYSAEVISQVGFDAVTCDMQHGLVDYATLIGMLTAISTTTATPLVRVPALDPAIIGRVLDAGVLGIICPMINTAADAEKLVGACRYAPQGWRSYGPNRAAWLGPNYVADANQAIVPFAMIETREALDNLDAILSVEGMQAIYVGPADLSLSLGYTPRADPVDAEMIEVIAQIGRRARDKGVIAGIHTGSAVGAVTMIDQGYQFVSLPNDRIMMEITARKMLGDVRAGHEGQKPDNEVAPGY